MHAAKGGMCEWVDMLTCQLVESTRCVTILTTCRQTRERERDRQADDESAGSKMLEVQTGGISLLLILYEHVHAGECAYDACSTLYHTQFASDAHNTGCVMLAVTYTRIKQRIRLHIYRNMRKFPCLGAGALACTPHAQRTERRTAAARAIIELA